MNYIEKSIHAIGSIDPEQLACLPKGPELNRGSGFSMHSLGGFAIDGQIVSVGLKVPLPGCDLTPTWRIINELATATLLVNRAPELEPLLPRFMGLVAVGEAGATAAILTEDASRGGASKVWPSPVYDRSKRILAERFGCGGSQDAFDRVFESGRGAPLERTLDFDVDGEERWLDLRPAPFTRRYLQETRYMGLNMEAADAVEAGQLSVVVGPDTVLGTTLALPTTA